MKSASMDENIGNTEKFDEVYDRFKKEFENEIWPRTQESINESLKQDPAHKSVLSKNDLKRVFLKFIIPELMDS